MSEYYMFNKPRGCITARRDTRQKTVMDYFPEGKRDVLFPVGRLDKDTEGFILITDDGKLCFELMSPENLVPKTYFFWVQGVLSLNKIHELESGVSIYKNSPYETSPAKIAVERVGVLRQIKNLLIGDDIKLSNKRGELPVTAGYITITEGKKHQVKRMLRYAGCRVVYLKRVSIGEICLDETLELGAYRELSQDEVKKLNKKMSLT